jgi:dTDP-4-dehydrorhamnose 3,5-epimerase
MLICAFRIQLGQHWAMPTTEPTSSILPDGVIVRSLVANIDPRGNLVEVYREQWSDRWRVLQFNAVISGPGVLRGVHVHATHWDYIVLLSGRMLLGLYDLRPSSPTQRLSSMTELAGQVPAGVVIPAGVGHGMYFPEQSTVLYGLSRHWDGSDELLCRWDAPELKLAWPTRTPILSERDATAGGYQDWRTAFEAARARAQGARPSESTA